MSKSGTASTVLIEGNYAEFLAAIIRQAPRKIDPDTIQNWLRNQEALKNVLEEALTPCPLNFFNDLILDDWKLDGEIGKPIFTSVRDIGRLQLVESLKEKEDWVDGETLVVRAGELDANLGWDDAKFLLKRQDKISEKFREFHLVFTGTIWRNDVGDRWVAFLYWYGGSWRGDFWCLDDGFPSDVRLVRLGE